MTSTTTRACRSPGARAAQGRPPRRGRVCLTTHPAAGRHVVCTTGAPPVHHWRHHTTVGSATNPNLKSRLPPAPRFCVLGNHDYVRGYLFCLFWGDGGRSGIWWRRVGEPVGSRRWHGGMPPCGRGVGSSAAHSCSLALRRAIQATAKRTRSRETPALPPCRTRTRFQPCPPTLPPVQHPSRPAGRWYSR